MTEVENLVFEMAAGLKLLTNMLGLTIALLPEADRAVALDALAALQEESSPAEHTARSEVATRSLAEAGSTMTTMIEKFAAEIAAAREVRPLET